MSKQDARIISDLDIRTAWLLFKESSNENAISATSFIAGWDACKKSDRLKKLEAE